MEHSDYDTFAWNFARGVMDRVVRNHNEYAAYEKLSTLITSSVRVSIDGRDAPFHNVECAFCYNDDDYDDNDGCIKIGLSLAPGSEFRFETDAYSKLAQTLYPNGWKQLHGVCNVGIVSTNASLVSLFPDNEINASIWISKQEMVLEELLMIRTEPEHEAFDRTKWYISNVGDNPGEAVIQLDVRVKYSDVMATRSTADVLRTSLGALHNIGPNGTEATLLKEVLYANLLPRMPPVLFAGGRDGWWVS